MEPQIDRAYIKSLLSGLSERTISFPPVYARITGKMTAGVALAQLVYWWSTEKGRWIYKTDAEICNETALSPDEWVGAKKLLKASGFVSIELRGLPAKSHYFIHIDKITDAIVELQDSGISRNKIRDCKSGAQDSGISGTQIREFPETCSGDSPKHSYIVEITTENTTESTDAPAHFADAEIKRLGPPPMLLVPVGESGKEITGPEPTKRKLSKKAKASGHIADSLTEAQFCELWQQADYARENPQYDPALIYNAIYCWCDKDKKNTGSDWMRRARQFVLNSHTYGRPGEFVRKAPGSVAAQVKMAQEAGYQPTQKEIAAAQWKEMQERNAAKSPI